MVVAILQARYSSTRLPGKVLMDLGGEPMLKVMISRVKKSRLLDKIIVATSTESSDNPIELLCHELQVPCFRGDLNDVLDRFYRAASEAEAEYIIRLTGDCPLIDPVLIDHIAELIKTTEKDYISNTLKPTFPDGQDVEAFTFTALHTAWNEAILSSEREHVTPYIWKNSNQLGNARFSAFNYENNTDLSSFRLTVDEMQDFILIQKLIEVIGKDSPWLDYVNHLQKHPELLMINRDLKRNEGYIKSLNQDGSSAK